MKTPEVLIRKKKIRNAVCSVPTALFYHALPIYLVHSFQKAPASSSPLHPAGAS